MTSTSKAIGRRGKVRITTVTTRTPVKRQHNVGMGTFAVALAGLVLALVNYVY